MWPELKVCRHALIFNSGINRIYIAETNLYNRHGWVDIGYRLITDNTPPEIGVDKEDGLCVIRAAIKITATDTGAGVKRITYAWSDAETPPAAGWTIVESDTATAIEEDEGIWYLHIRSTDNVDNVSSIVTYGPYEVIHMSASDFKVTQIYDLAWREYYFDMSNGTDTNNDGEPDTFPKHSNTDIITTQMPINKSGLVSYIREGIKPGYKFEGEVTVIGEPDTVRFIINYYINGNRNTDIIQCSHAGEDKFTYEWIVPLETDKHSFIEFNLEAIKGEETFGNEVWLDEWPEGNISRRVMYVVDGSALDDLLFIQSQ